MHKAIAVHAQRWKVKEIFLMEIWIVKMIQFAEMTTLSCLIKEGIIINCLKDCKSFMDIVLNMDKNELLIY